MKTKNPAGSRLAPTPGSPRVDDIGVLRKYNDPAPNPMFSEVQRACIRFVRYKEKVPCALCGKQSKKHWTGVVRFKSANLDDNHFEVKLRRNWFKAGQPVCEDHPLQPDEREFMQKVRAAHRQANAGDMR